MDDCLLSTHTLVLQNHLAADILETYVLGGIAAADADHVDEHLSACEECRHLVTHVEWAVSLAGTAALRLSGVLAVHATPDGPVTLTVRRAADGWRAVVRGPLGESEATTTEADAARAWCGNAFRSQYPNHACTAGCRCYGSTSGE